MLIKKIAEIKIRTGLGMSWFYELKNALLISASLKVLLNLETMTAGVLTLFALSCFYLAGAFDIKFLKLYQTMQELNTFKYNKFKKSLKRK